MKKSNEPNTISNRLWSTMWKCSYCHSAYPALTEVHWAETKAALKAWALHVSTTETPRTYSSQSASDGPVTGASSPQWQLSTHFFVLCCGRGSRCVLWQNLRWQLVFSFDPPQDTVYRFGHYCIYSHFDVKFSILNSIIANLSVHLSHLLPGPLIFI